MNNNELINLRGTNLYMKSLDCLNELFADFAGKNEFPFPDMNRTFNGNDMMYFTVNVEDNSIKFIMHSSEDNTDRVVKEWKDADIINTFMAFHQLYCYYTASEKNKD